MKKIAELFNVAGYGAVVTGGASGIGLAFTEALAGNGARVTMLDVHPQRIESETKRLRAAGLDVRGKMLDVTDHKALDAAIDAAAQEYGRLDVVCANAGVDSGVGFVGSWVASQRQRVTEGALENYTDERWNRVIDINLNGVFATTRAAARHMKPRKSGRIIITTSMAATHVEPAIGSAYMAAKAGAAHFMRSAALELAAYNITVNAIAPGFIVTNIGGGHAHDLEKQKTVGKAIPMHRVGFPEDLEGLALFLASPGSGYVTGQEIIIDGGWGLGTAD
ncbi:MAG TPA: SDR family NAD(P)-dependent oxidoreductase [Steroidobacteraceae bacterium]|nr:SDR family NAD(P)-dependent oxidoreductase [Steroidobacteraceae bacterium]